MPRGKGSRLIGKQKTSTAASISAGNKSADDLRAFINGGLINQGSASSVWTLREQFNQKKSGTWAGDLGAVSNAVAQPGGTMTVNSQPLGSYDYTFYNGPQTVSSCLLIIVLWERNVKPLSNINQNKIILFFQSRVSELKILFH